MSNILKQNWDVELSGSWNNATSGPAYTDISRAFNPEDDFKVANSAKITKISVKTSNKNAAAHKIFLITLADKKIFYVSEPITPVKTGENNLLEIDTDILVTPEMGHFCLGYSVVTGNLYSCTIIGQTDDTKIGFDFIDGTGANNAVVGREVKMRNIIHRNCLFGVKLEFDRDVATDPDPIDLKLHILLKTGQTVNLTGYLWPVGNNPPNLSWSSADPAIASVGQNGTVTANRVGKTKIYVENEDGSFKALARIKVVEEGEAELLLSILLEIGESCILVPEFDPQKAETAVLWTSSDSAIATVNAVGKVTGLSEGLAIITAQTADGKLTDSLYITVKAGA